VRGEMLRLMRKLWEAGISRREKDAKMDEEQDFRASSNFTTYDVLHVTSSC